LAAETLINRDIESIETTISVCFVLFCLVLYFCLGCTELLIRMFVNSPGQPRQNSVTGSVYSEFIVPKYKRGIILQNHLAAQCCTCGDKIEKKLNISKIFFMTCSSALTR